MLLQAAVGDNALRLAFIEESQRDKRTKVISGVVAIALLKAVFRVSVIAGAKLRQEKQGVRITTARESICPFFNQETNKAKEAIKYQRRTRPTHSRIFNSRNYLEKMNVSTIPIERIQEKIYVIRGQKVMLDGDLAALYGVETKALNQAVKRNLDRFPADFMFQLTPEEATSLRSQIVTLEKGRGKYSKYAPLAFTEHGVAMLSSVLRSKEAVAVNIQIVRSFIKLRELLLSNQSLAYRVAELEQESDRHSKAIISIIQALESPKVSPTKRRIGF